MTEKEFIQRVRQMKTAVILFAYNRPQYLRRAIKTHVMPGGLDTYAFIDLSDKKEVIDIIHNSGLYNVVINRKEHYGLNRNIIEGINRVLQDYDSVIVLEDDLLLADDGIMWLKENLYNHHTVSLLKPTEVLPFRCWGWGMKKEIWDQIDWSLLPERKNRDSWDVIVNENFLQNRWRSLGPKKPKVKHIGWSGQHVKQFDRFSIRYWLRRYNEWKNDYYRDKDILMKKEKFPYNLFRVFK